MASTQAVQVKSSEDLVDWVRQREQTHEARTTAESRKQLGQVFTPPAVCRYMASLWPDFPREFRLLDPGAGVGGLTAAVCERYLSLPAPRLLEVCCYENDSDAAGLLEETLKRCQRALRLAGHTLRFEIRNDDFVLAHVDLFSDTRSLFSTNDEPTLFDGVITNPPYFKLNKDSPQARMMDRVVHGQPNIYALFLAVAARLLRDSGQLVAITPRSFCNGLYFRGFRRWFFDRMRLAHVHAFQSRTATFQEANILQESVITRFIKTDVAPASVIITRTHGRDFSGSLDEQTLPYTQVVDDRDSDMLIRIPETSQDSAAVSVVESWPQRFEETGLRISTGPVVMFRVGPFLLDEPDGESSVPLLSAHNVKAFRTNWPVPKKKWPTAFVDSPASQKHLLRPRNYVLLKRFSAKEERRRLTAGCLAADAFPAPRIALENHLNYIYHAQRELTTHEMFGIAAVFNSALFDRYFRTISGNTQVNATEIRQLPFPDLKTLGRLGARICAISEFEPRQVECAVNNELGIDEITAKYLKGFSQ